MHAPYKIILALDVCVKINVLRTGPAIEFEVRRSLKRTQLLVRKQFAIGFERSLGHSILLRRREADILVSCILMARQMTRIRILLSAPEICCDSNG